MNADRDVNAAATAGSQARSFPGFSARACTGMEIFDSMDRDDRESATVLDYRGGSIIVHLNRYEIGHSLKKRPLPRNSIVRWLLTRGYLPATWSLQVQHGSAGMGTSAFTKMAAVAEGKQWIDARLKAEGGTPNSEVV